MFGCALMWVSKSKCCSASCSCCVTKAAGADFMLVLTKVKHNGNEYTVEQNRGVHKMLSTFIPLKEVLLMLGLVNNEQSWLGVGVATKSSSSFLSYVFEVVCSCRNKNLFSGCSCCHR